MTDTTRKPVIAIDGYSSTGKSSISKVIAKKLGLVHLDTGALYRGITYYALENCMNDKDIDFVSLHNCLSHIKLEFREEDSELLLFLNGKNINEEIRDPQISDYVSFVARQPEVREFLLAFQQKMAEKGGIIMDGRDIGTVVLPNADFKFFLTANPAERARRRYLELQNAGVTVDLEEVKTNLLARDKIDSEREASPLRQAEDAILIDNSGLTKQQTIELILEKVRQ